MQQAVKIFEIFKRIWFNFDEFSGMQEAVNMSLANSLTFPFIEERVKAGKLHIYGMHYDFVEGQLTSNCAMTESDEVFGGVY